jgi:hypothetical protein
MDPKRWQNIEQLYHAALEREPSGRTAFLAEVCQSDHELRREVESLLAQSDSSSEALTNSPAWQAVTNLRAILRSQGRTRKCFRAFRLARYWHSAIAS